jgi:very-short-patch-repair endonuclease
MVLTSIRRAAAKKLRANTTPHERVLWRALKELPLEGTHFRRQASIGPYVVNFFCPARRLIIELDGGHHNEDADITMRMKRRSAIACDRTGLKRMDIAWSVSGIQTSLAILMRCSKEFTRSFMARQMPKRFQ